jgi:hypothetical protein
MDNQPHTYLANASGKKEAKITELLLQEIKLKHGRIKNNRKRIDPSNCPVLIIHGSSGRVSDNGRRKILGGNGIVVDLLGNYHPHGLSVHRKANKEINGLHLPLGYKFDSVGS